MQVIIHYVTAEVRGAWDLSFDRQAFYSSTLEAVPLGPNALELEIGSCGFSATQYKRTLKELGVFRS